MRLLPIGSAPTALLELPEHRPLVLRSRKVDELVGRSATLLGFGYVPGEFAALDGRGAADTDWVVYSAETDPQVLSRRLAITDEARRRLQGIFMTGARFDRILICHELPPGTLRRLKRTGRLTPETVARLLPTTTDRRVPRLAGDAAAALRALGVGAAIGVGAAVAAPLAIGALAISGGLDPAVIGIVTASGKGCEGELGAVWMLASWA